MQETVQLALPEPVAQLAREIADRTQRRLEDVLVEWLQRAADEQPIEILPDDQVLALAGLQMSDDLQEELSNLLARNREGQLTPPEHTRLDDLMSIYRRGLVRKAQAVRVAVERGLRPPLSRS